MNDRGQAWMANLTAPNSSKLPQHSQLIRPGSGVLTPILCGDFYVLPQVDFLKQFQLKPHYQKRKHVHTLQPVQLKTMLAGRPPILRDDLNATVNFTLNCTLNTLAAVIATIFGYLNKHGKVK